MGLADDALSGLSIKGSWLDESADFPEVVITPAGRYDPFHPRTVYDGYPDAIRTVQDQLRNRLVADENAIQLETGPPKGSWSWVDALRKAHREGRERWMNTPPPGHPGNPIHIVVPAWYDELCRTREGVSAQEFATKMFRPYLVEIEVLRS